jgi:hypothetical protein
MRPHARHAPRSTRPRTARPLSRHLPRLLGWAVIQVGSQCASRRIPGVRCGAACGKESRGLEHLCMGCRGITSLRRHVVRAPYLVCSVPPPPPNLLKLTLFLKLPSSQVHFNLAWFDLTPTEQPRTWAPTRRLIAHRVRVPSYLISATFTASR